MTRLRRILIVEDEPLIAIMLEDFLDALDRAAAGTADSVATALELVEQGGFDAAILDVNLRAGEQCWPVVEALLARGVPVVLATGGPNEAIPLEYRDRPMLAKPFTIDSVEKALDSLS